jgi:hypothetical protein
MVVIAYQAMSQDFGSSSLTIERSFSMTDNAGFSSAMGVA